MSSSLCASSSSVCQNSGGAGQTVKERGHWRRGCAVGYRLGSHDCPVGKPPRTRWGRDGGRALGSTYIMNAIPERGPQIRSQTPSLPCSVLLYLKTRTTELGPFCIQVSSNELKEKSNCFKQGLTGIRAGHSFRGAALCAAGCSPESLLPMTGCLQYHSPNPQLLQFRISPEISKHPQGSKNTD